MRYEYEYVWAWELVGSWGVELQSYIISLNMQTSEVVHLNGCITIVVELKFGLNHALYSYVIVSHIYNFDSWKSKYKNLVLIGKNKMR